MELKRILAKDSRAASEQAMQQYGRDVLIISSNRVNGQTELIVAVDVGGSVGAAPPKACTDTPNAQQRAPEASDEDESFAQLFAQVSAPASTPVASIVPVPSATASENPLAAQYDSLRGSEIVALLKSELGALRQEMRLHQQLTLAQAERLQPSLQPLMDELVERGLPPGLREHMTRAWQRLDDPVQALGLLESELTRLLPPSQPPVSLQGIHVLVGPSGAGKSLACAKLAQIASEALGPDAVAWISYADHRTGAWSQTQMLAAPSGVATFRAGNADGLALLLGELTHLKLVLIDTSGVGFEQQLERVRELVPQAQIHLVVPLDATLTSVKHALRHSDTLSTVILSKLDECYAPWATIQGLSQKQIHVSWINDSERVHTPLQIYAPQTVAEKALNTLGQIDDPHADDASSAQRLRLADMHEVPDLTAALEPFGDEPQTPAQRRAVLPQTLAPMSVEQYGIPQFARIHLMS